MSQNDRRRNILIISEGYEEKPYIDKVLSFPNINKSLYNIYPSINVKGNGNIPARFQYELQRGFFDAVLIFCDTDKGSAEFLSLLHKIGEQFFRNEEDAFEVFIFANPVTLQIVLSHFGDVCLTKVSKHNNARAVKELTGIENYNASQTQIKEMIEMIHYSSLDGFKERMKKISMDFNDIPSTNFLKFLERFESHDSTWIDRIKELRKE